MTTDKRSESKKDVTYGTGIGLAIGVGLGVVFGLLMDSLALGIAFGAAIGIALGFSIPSARRGKTQVHENTRRFAQNKTVYLGSAMASP